ncbi:Uncharacterised protein [Mycobacterium senegalense]|uniref:Uncharacterized protein n=1 Tax=Mycolicibacterium senegalense TaxID=1796 RepID=A0A378W8D0_9MYCO|nr:Uncharacterised protein [Mycolicibacterium senegalense]
MRRHAHLLRSEHAREHRAPPPCARPPARLCPAGGLQLGHRVGVRRHGGRRRRGGHAAASHRRLSGEPARARGLHCPVRAVLPVRCRFQGADRLGDLDHRDRGVAVRDGDTGVQRFRSADRGTDGRRSRFARRRVGWLPGLADRGHAVDDGRRTAPPRRPAALSRHPRNGLAGGLSRAHPAAAHAPAAGGSGRPSPARRGRRAPPYRPRGPRRNRPFAECDAPACDRCPPRVAAGS